MRRKVQIVSIALLVVPLFLHAYTVGKLPAEITFGTLAERTDWHYVNSGNAQSNTWMVGRLPEFAYKGAYMLYMSPDQGSTCSYTTVAGDTIECLTYCPITGLPAGQYAMDFHYRGPRDTTGTLCAAVLSSAPTLSTSFEGATECPADFWWHDARYTFTAASNTTYYLCFYARCYSEKAVTDTGWAIDDIQIYPTGASPQCAQKPVGLKRARQGNNSVFTWEGNAAEYQVEYYTSDSSSPTFRTTDNITSNSFMVNTASIPEGTYHFRVRAICELDTSAWTSIDYQLMYDVSKRCVDYLDVSAGAAEIHHYPHDYDRLTDYRLRTFPTGFPAAVRLGDSQASAQNTSVIYTTTPAMGVLQVHYALVMQLPNHTSETQPHFTLELLDEAGNLLDSCDKIDFASNWSTDTTWHKVKIDGIEDTVLWKDWSLVGVNMRHYIGSPVQIRITASDCGDGNHFGYGYFVLSCSPGEIEGTHCGKQPDSLWVDEGFYYRWYRKYETPRVIVGTDRTYIPDYMPFDSATYCVDMINKIDTNCFFTLEASTLAFRTVPVASGKYDPGACTNYVQFYNDSYTIGEYWDADQQKWVEKMREDGVARWYWDFGKGRRSMNWSPRQDFPNAGETLHVTLHTFVDDCEATQSFDIVVPAIGTRRTYRNYQFCEGDVFIDSLYHYADGKPHIYSEEGDYTIDSLISWEGCDSLIILSLRYYFHLQTQRPKDTLCMSVGSMEWHGRTLTHGGTYHDTLRSEVHGCDSIIYIFELAEQPILDMSVAYEPQSFCTGGGVLEVPFSITSGASITYDLLFNDTAKMLGFKDRMNQPVNLSDTKLTIPLDTVWPGPCKADLIFRNYKCDTAWFPIAFDIYYDPDSLITQRWNDFLSVRKPAYEYYGGFEDYQWYKDDAPIAGQTASYLYVPNQGLQPSSPYWVEFTRTHDGIRTRTCAFYPTVQSDSVTLIVTPTIIKAQQRTPVRVQTSENGQVVAYNQSGEQVGQWALKQEENQLLLPPCKGLYLLRVLFDDGRVETRKIIVE